MRGPIIIEFRAEFSSVEGTFNNQQLTLGVFGSRVLGSLGLGFGGLGFGVEGLGLSGLGFWGLGV